MKKIAFFDIDGTMVNVPNGMMHPSRQTIRVITEFKNQGNYIVVASARGSVPESVKNINFDGYILNDGHYILFDHEILVNDLHTIEEITRQINLYDNYDGCYSFGGHAKEWCSHLDHPLMIDHLKMFQGIDTRPIGVIEEYSASDVEAVSCCAMFNHVDDLIQCYSELKDDFTVIPYYSGLIRMDVYHKGFTKGTACEYLYKKLNIDRMNAYAFGDGDNDTEMLQLVGHGIAMGNASDEIKKYASEVTDSVDHDGIAQAFKKHFDI